MYEIVPVILDIQKGKSFDKDEYYTFFIVLE